MRGVIYVEGSENRKILGSKKVDSTYSSIKATCPDSCSLKADGFCYATSGRVGMIVSKLDKKARQHSPLKLARAEAKAIDQSYNGGKVPAGRAMRIHVSGDCRVIKGAGSIRA